MLGFRANNGKVFRISPTHIRRQNPMPMETASGLVIAEEERFELSMPCDMAVFKTAGINRYPTPPCAPILTKTAKNAMWALTWYNSLYALSWY